MNEFDKVQFEIALKQLKQSKPMMDEFIEVKAAQLWVAFKKLQKVGFKDEQALEIIKSRGDLTTN